MGVLEFLARTSPSPHTVPDLPAMASQVIHAIVGTAGHIDHGKTALIRALTGQETDRLKEEQERGISIDLGFAYFTLPDGKIGRAHV